MHYDSIVVGGGTAGSVVAARLSEDPSRRVLLLEAGPDYPEEVPGELLDPRTAVTRGHNWDLQAIVNEDDTALTGPLERVSRVLQLAAKSRLAPGQSAPKVLAAGIGSATRFQYPLGKVVGGGSAINGALAFHARPEDFAAWEAAGNLWWSWENVRDVIRRIDSGDGTVEPLPLETVPVDGLTRCQAGFLDACLSLGYARTDLRGGTAPGAGMIPKNVRNGRRVSMAAHYLAAARRRPNLTIQPHCLASRLLFAEGNGTTVSGVEAVIDGRLQRLTGGEVVLTAGAIGSPVVLLRSGIGAAEEVRRIGGTLRVSLPGVGKNLVDHPAVSIWGVPRAGACVPGEPIHQVLLQQRSSASGALCDLQLFMLSAVPTEMLPPLRDVVGADIAVGISVIVATPVSTGRVELPDGDLARHPRIYLNCMKEPGDLRRMSEGLREAWRILQGDRLGAHFERVVLWNQRVVDSDSLLEKMIRTSVRGVWHPAGTLRMGREDDEAAVVDQHGRLFGCRNLTVADASIMPVLPSVPTNLTCVLIAERIAGRLCGS